VGIYRNFLVVAEARIGGAAEPRNFILDTGTAPSVLNARFAGQLGLATTPSSIRVLGKTVAAEAAIVPEIEIGPIRAFSVQVRVQNLSHLENDLGIPIAGILGLDVLSKASFRLDYEKSEIQFGESLRVGISVRLDPRTGLAVAQVKIDEKDARLLLDTGSDRVVLFGGNFAEVGWLALRSTSQSGASLIDQKMHVQVFSAANIALGGQQFSADRAYFVPGNADPVFDGLLGIRALGFRALFYDRECETVYLQK
jgi:predicted aspartyl protease